MQRNSQSIIIKILNGENGVGDGMKEERKEFERALAEQLAAQKSLSRTYSVYESCRNCGTAYMSTFPYGERRHVGICPNCGVRND